MMIRTLAACLLVLSLGVHDVCSGEKKFKHPSVLSTQSDLAAMRKRVTRGIAKAAYERFSRKYSNVKRPHTPYATVKVVPSGTCKEEDAFRKDAQAAHAMALMWVDSHFIGWDALTHGQISRLK